MPLPTFKSLHDFDSSFGYGVTNEEPDTFRSLIARRRFTRAAGIVSGGEVFLFTLLPHCVGELIGVDHSLHSLAATWLKILMMDSLGPLGLKKLIVDGTYQSFIKAAESYFPRMDAKFAPYLVLLNRYQSQSAKDLKCVTETDFNCLQRIYQRIPDSILRVVAKRLDRVTILHGDVRDLGAYAPFDIIYISNAWDGSHMGRVGLGRLDLNDGVYTLLKPGGSILATGFPSYIPTHWKVDRVKPLHGSAWMEFVRIDMAAEDAALLKGAVA